MMWCSAAVRWRNGAIVGAGVRSQGLAVREPGFSQMRGDLEQKSSCE